MADTLFDYLRWRGDLSFARTPPGPLDFLILSQLVHAPLENLKGNISAQECTLRALSCIVYPAEPEKGIRELYRKRWQLWQAAAASLRFGSLRLLSYASVFNQEENRQFAAGLFADETGKIIAFRGTDATLAGWHEDFNLAYETPVPAQRDAVSFLNAVAGTSGAVYLCGHSKGGNLAKYAAACCAPAVRRRIRGVFSFDAPGLDDATLNSPGMAEVSGCIRSFVPESSVVGQLLSSREESTVVASDSVSVLQHNPFYWHLDGPSFETVPGISLSSRITGQTMDTFLKNCTPHIRRSLVNVLFDILEASQAVRLCDVGRGLLLHADEVARVIMQIPAEDWEAVSTGLRLLGEALGDTLGGAIPDLGALLNPVLTGSATPASPETDIKRIVEKNS